MSATLFLYVCITGTAAGSPNFLCKEFPMPDWQTCKLAISTLRIEPNGTLPSGGDKQVNTVFAYCAGQGQYQKDR